MISEYEFLYNPLPSIITANLIYTYDYLRINIMNTILLDSKTLLDRIEQIVRRL